MQTFMDKHKNALLRKYHALLRQAGVNACEKEALLSSYGVESSKDLTVYELTELCGKLDLRANPKANQADIWRKRLIAAINGYLTAAGKRNININEIKAIACRAAKTDNFNHIPLERLKSLYNAFKNQEKDFKTLKIMTNDVLVNFFKDISIGDA